MMPLRVLASWIVARLDIRSERGATGVEYGIFIGMIAAVMILAVVFLGNETRKNFQCASPPRAC
jgi:pilus assembly protein Flp/PilA